jgi:hypothetical protein
MLSQNPQPSPFLYIQTDVPPGVELREWRRLGESHRPGLRQRLRRARHHAVSRAR